MAITKQGDSYRLDIYPEGRKGKRVVRLFSTKNEARKYQKSLLSGIIPDAHDNRRLSELIELWYELHGRSLKSAIDTCQRLKRIAIVINNPEIKHFTVETFANYRKERIASGISESTLNRELSTLKSMFRELKRMGILEYDLKLLEVRKLKEKRTELSYLTKTQIEKLMEEVTKSTNDSLELVVKISLTTGARWSECEGLRLENLHNTGFYFVDTKNGYSRFVPASKELYSQVKDRLTQGQFQSCYGAFRSAFKRTGIIVPAGQKAHILRHTFASYFVMRGGDIRTLQTILGHTSLQMTMRYSHLSPDYLNQAVSLNPLEN